MLAASKPRVTFIDWMRGVAAVIMLQGHTFDAFLRPADRGGAWFTYSQFFGGEAAAIFLFLTGATYGMGMNRREHMPPGARVLQALKRARFLFLLAILFRLQGWIFAWGTSPWTDLLKVDILNVMGATAALLAFLALFSGIDRVRWAVMAGTAIAAVSPVVTALHLGAIPGPLRDYFVPSGAMFSIFPWGAFLAFGIGVGSFIPLVERGGWNRTMQWSALLGFGLVFGGRYFADLPFSVYAQSEFWLNSPALVACKLGIALLLGAFAYLWCEYLAAGNWSWVRQLGTTSLLVYWVHVDLEYGPWFAKYRQHLNVPEVLGTAVVMIACMLGLSVGWTAVRKRRQPQAEPISVVELPLRREDRRRRA
ncbi:MAG: heparan-alpha-glucosaminide N-acetyltransferase domain-containing protein [Acidobacteriota bacterium]|nr:heparan-alpha-glucosaminide N-acetyltransferase domain-containing protein [Acidobacteriota bacterium]